MNDSDYEFLFTRVKNTSFREKYKHIYSKGINWVTDRAGILSLADFASS